MEVFVQRGASKGDCLEKIVNKYGIHFTILREKTIRSAGILGLFSREGVEVEFCLSSRRGGQGNTASEPYPFPYAESAAAPAYNANKQLKDDTTLDFVEAKKRVLAAAGKDPEQVYQKVQREEEKSLNQQLILDKLQEIQHKIETGAEAKQEHPNLIRIVNLLRHNDFSEPYIAGIMERARKELSLETLENFDAVQNQALVWIGETIAVYKTPRKAAASGGRRILVLIGPTGVGKTTTIAKLAAIYHIGTPGNPPLSVRMITIDAFRIGAKEQIEDYADIMEIGFSYVDNNRDLRREIDLYHEETDLILVDTIGRSPKDSVKLGEMKEILDVCGSKAEVHLVMSASTKTSDMEHILQQFEPFNYQAVMLTKLDETRHIGNIISALAERKKPVSYITDGQSVPKDIKKASVVRFLINLDEFRVDREEFEKRFPSAEADQFQWG